MAEPSGPRANFGQRLVALLIDGVILAVVGGVLGAVVGRTLGQGVSAVIGLAYYSYFEGGPTGQTLGKKVMSIRVIKLSDGEVLGTGVALVRAVARYISAIPCFLGFFWSLWDDESQTWHDKIAGTVVVPVADYPI